MLPAVRDTGDGLRARSKVAWILNFGFWVRVRASAGRRGCEDEKRARMKKKRRGKKEKRAVSLSCPLSRSQRRPSPPFCFFLSLSLFLFRLSRRAKHFSPLNAPSNHSKPMTKMSHIIQSKKKKQLTAHSCRHEARHEEKNTSIGFQFRTTADADVAFFFPSISGLAAPEARLISSPNLSILR